MRHNLFSWSKRIMTYILITTAMPVNADQIREIAAFNLHDVSIATYDQFGPVIYYNPYALQKLGPQIAQFVREHEYAHHTLNHIRRGKIAGQQTDIAKMHKAFELEADCYAAKKVSQYIAMAAADNFIQTQGVNHPDAHHPDGRERAMVIRQCAKIPN